MENAANDWMTLMALAFVLGLRHGMDADHLAAIDGLTRFNALARKRHARWCGVLFSLGHGLVVSAISVAAGLLAGNWVVAPWLEDLGAWISILFLLVLGCLNLAAVCAAQPDQVVQPVGLKGRWLGRLTRSSHPALIVTTGALFALSFDTMTQAVVFSVAAASVGGWGFSAMLGVTFMAGMMVTDGVNGMWVSRILARADRRARIASRVMGLAVAALSLAVGGFGLASYLFPAVADYGSGREFGFGVLFVAAMALSFLVALGLARKESALAAERG
jgi:high-affinity nickel-transport protein